MKADRIRATISVGLEAKILALVISTLKEITYHSDRNKVLKTTLIYFGWHHDSNNQWWHE